MHSTAHSTQRSGHGAPVGCVEALVNGGASEGRDGAEPGAPAAVALLRRADGAQSACGVVLRHRVQRQAQVGHPVAEILFGAAERDDNLRIIRVGSPRLQLSIICIAMHGYQHTGRCPGLQLN